jgi:hypothetical protein
MSHTPLKTGGAVTVAASTAGTDSHDAAAILVAAAKPDIQAHLEAKKEPNNGKVTAATRTPTPTKAGEKAESASAPAQSSNAALPSAPTAKAGATAPTAASKKAAAPTAAAPKALAPAAKPSASAKKK